MGSPVQAGTFPIANIAGVVEVVDQVAFLAAGSEGFLVIRVNDPTRPDLVARVWTGGLAMGVKVVNGLAFVSDGPDGLVIVDVTDTDNPRRLASHGTGGDGFHMATNPRCFALDLQSDGSLLATNEAEPGRRLQIEASIDLRNWQPWTTPIPTGAFTRIPLTTGSQGSQRYFRVVATQS